MCAGGLVRPGRSASALRLSAPSSAGGQARPSFHGRNTGRCHRSGASARAASSYLEWPGPADLGQRPRQMKPAQDAGGSAPGGWPVTEGTLLAGRYRLAERLRERCGSTEWRAADEALARPVAVRVFAPGFPRLSQVMAAVRAASRISDPRLARIYDADDCADPPFIVTEWPSGACLGDLLGEGPLDPRQAAHAIAEAAEALAAVHEAGLAHLCLGLESLWRNPGGEITVTGLGIAALSGAQTVDPALADTQGLARLLYAALTGYWPGEEQTALPPAPHKGGRMRRPALLRPGIPAGIDSVTYRALSGQVSQDMPQILCPAQLAMELAAVTRPSLQSGYSPSTLPLPVELAGAAPTLPDGPAALRPPSSRTARRLRRLTGIIIVLALLGAGSWLTIRAVTAQHRPTAAVGARPSAAVQTLTPVNAAAFGPLGESDGDNPQLARFAIGGNHAAAWHTHWYTTPGFGNLKPGTGLLLDMGRPVTITSAHFTLGPITGANVQLRAGSEPAFSDLRPIARTVNAGGDVTLRPSSRAKGRYLLIWFTRLPPDASGTFEAVVYGVRLRGTTW